MGYVREGLGIYFHGNIDILHTTTDLHGIRCHLVGTDSNGIDADAQAFGYLGSGHWRQVTTVVGTIGQQNDHAAFGL